jgi:hypothetical protein
MDLNGPDTNRSGQRYPHLAPREQDAATIALLAAQGRQLLTEVAPVLSRQLELVPGTDAPAKLLGTVPQLVLKVFPLNARRQWTPAELPTILQAFASLARHAQQLDAFPLLKTQFWKGVVQACKIYVPGDKVQKQELGQAEFPEYAVDFGGYGFGEDRRMLIMDSAFEDALVSFMTTPAGAPSVTTRPTTSMGFMFSRCCLRVDTLEVLERFLDRSFASPRRQFDVRKLELSHDDLMPPDLDVLARIVDKCIHRYGVEELRLEELVPNYVGGFRTDWRPPSETPAAWLAITRAVFAIDALPALASRAVKTTTPSSLRRVSLSGNYACLAFFAMRFSALRYGCRLEQDTTTYLQKRTHRDARGDDYWRWLAFGLFYPRPKRFATHLRLRKIGHIKHCPLSAKVFAQTLRNPAAELIFGGSRSDLEPTTELLVCSIKAGARVDVFQTGHSGIPMWSETFATACELEAIYERADGAVCVAVPGVGLGWVQSEWIDSIEREPLSCARNELVGLFAGDLSSSVHMRPDTKDMWSVKSVGESLQSMVKLIGYQFRAIEFGHYPFPVGLMPLLLTHCTGLTELMLSGQKILLKESNTLLEALSTRGALGDRLQVLNLNYSRTLTKKFLARLLSILLDAANLTALRELRIATQGLDDSQLKTLKAILQMRPNLAIVESQTGSHSWRTNRRIAVMKARINAAFHGQVLGATVGRQAKYAFLSVIAGRAGSAIQSLDVSLVQLVFAFAAERVVRRVLLWEEPIGYEDVDLHDLEDDY